MASLQEGIDYLYNKVVIEGSSQAPDRMKEIGAFCVHELEQRGLADGLLPEQGIHGHLREKQWDVAYKLHNKHRLAISLKSILKNLAGTVPNRGDDLMGEASNLQLWSPEIVIGYFMVFDTSADYHSTKYGSTWCELLKKRLQQVTGRSAPSWGFGMVEAAVVVQVDFSQGPVLLTPEEELAVFFDVLAAEVQRRNPYLLAHGAPIPPHEQRAVDLPIPEG
jgi:hypothetical protein